MGACKVAFLAWLATVADGLECRLNAKVIDASTFGEVAGELAGSLLAGLCGRNRGIFVLEPGDGHVYSCGKFPAAWAEDKTLLEDEAVPWDANGVVTQFEAGSLDAEAAVKVYDAFAQAVFASSPGAEGDIHACDAGGLVALDCDDVDVAAAPLRLVSAAGLYVDDDGSGAVRYGPEDFGAIKALGLNGLRIPVPASFFETESSVFAETLYATMQAAANSGLSEFVVALRGAHGTEEVANAVKFAATVSAQFAGRIAAVEVDASADVGQSAVAAAAAAGVLVARRVPDEDALRTFDEASTSETALSFGQDRASTVVDVASSTPAEDRAKLFYHEAVACGSVAPLRFAACAKRKPVIVSSFSLAIDDCGVPRKDRAGDFGQCDNLDDRLESPWWRRHYASLARRQVHAFEMAGAGWAFGRWKFPDSSHLHGAAKAQLALKDAADLGWFPPLGDAAAATKDDGDSDEQQQQKSRGACLHAPVPDFALGDATLAPTAKATPEPDPAQSQTTDAAPKKCDPPLDDKVAYATYGAGALLAALALAVLFQRHVADAQQAPRSPYAPVDTTATSGTTELPVTTRRDFA